MNCMSIECGRTTSADRLRGDLPRPPFGTDVIRPDFRYLLEEPKRPLRALVTHGHEDHIGAMPYLLREHPMPRVRPPVRARPGPRAALRARPRHAPELIPIAPGQRHRFGPFEAEPIRVTHSIADATSLALRTPGRHRSSTPATSRSILRPPDHEHFDADRFRALGDAGVRLLLSDSTNVDTEGRAGSEQPVAGPLEELVEEATRARADHAVRLQHPSAARRASTSRAAPGASCAGSGARCRPTPGWPRRPATWSAPTNS